MVFLELWKEKFMNKCGGDRCVGRSQLSIQKTYVCRGEVCLSLLPRVAEGLCPSPSRGAVPAGPSRTLLAWGWPLLSSSCGISASFWEALKSGLCAL